MPDTLLMPDTLYFAQGTSTVPFFMAFGAVKKRRFSKSGVKIMRQ